MIQYHTLIIITFDENHTLDTDYTRKIWIHEYLIRQIKIENCTLINVGNMLKTLKGEVKTLPISQRNHQQGP